MMLAFIQRKITVKDQSGMIGWCQLVMYPLIMKGSLLSTDYWATVPQVCSNLPATDLALKATTISLLKSKD